MRQPNHPLGSAPPVPRLAPDPCLSEDQILAFVEGRHDASVVCSVDRHLDQCGACTALMLAVLPLGADFVASHGTDPRCWCFEPGSVLAERYAVRRPLGRGGMGDVYEALDVLSGRLVAVKTARAVDGDNPEVCRRLMSEARLARRVRHANVCRVHEFVVHSDDRFPDGICPLVIMDRIDGVTLARRPSGRCLLASMAESVARDLLRGLAAIHSARIIHRDIKSQNVLLTQASGTRAIIIDFGLAVDARRAARSGESLEGSLAYMAPEQLEGGHISYATDVFALGVVLFEAFTGRRPFEHRVSRRRPARSRVRSIARPRQVVPMLPCWTDAFVARCLEHEPDARFVDAGEALRAFEAMNERCDEPAIGSSN